MGIQTKNIVFKKENKFNRDKYLKNIKELIICTYHTDKETAMKAINRSGLLKSLSCSPEMTTHIPDEDWASKIWNGYKDSYRQ